MDQTTTFLQAAARQAWWHVMQSVDLLDNWPQALAALCDDVRGRPPESPLVLKFVDGLELEMMPGGIGAYTNLFPEIFCRRVYEPPEFTFGDAPVIVDLGANVGFFTCKMARQFPRGRVVAVEVMPQYCELLRANAKRNQLGNVTVIEAAIGDGQTNTEIRYWFTKTGYLKVTATVPSDVDVSVLKAPSTTLRRVLDDNDISSCDLLKVDIEGHEYAMLSAAEPRDLRRCRQIAMEWHPCGTHDDPRRIAAVLTNAGFEILPSAPLDRSSGVFHAIRT